MHLICTMYLKPRSTIILIQFKADFRVIKINDNFLKTFLIIVTCKRKYRVIEEDISPRSPSFAAKCSDASVFSTSPGSGSTPHSLRRMSKASDEPASIAMPKGVKLTLISTVSLTSGSTVETA